MTTKKELQFAQKISPSLKGHALIAAPTGSGKSYAVGAMIERLYAEKQPTLILDTKTINHIGLCKGKNRLKRFNFFRIFEDTRLTMGEYREMITKNPYLLCIPAGDISIDTLIEEYKTILRTVQKYKIPRHLVVEETHHYCKSAQKAIPELEWIVREGRGYKIWLWSITQRIQSFPKDVWANCQWTYLMHMRIPQDINYAAALIPEFPQINDDLNRFDLLQYNHEPPQRSAQPYLIIRADDVCRKTTHLG